MINKKIKKILNKKNKQKITCLTAYTYPVAQIVDKYCDITLVGDSVGMVLYGMKSTKKVSLDMMILHAKSVVRGCKKSLVVVDMPYRTYSNKISAFKNAKRIIKETKCHAIKLEGGKKIFKIVEYLVKKKIPVVGHVGLLPQYAGSNYKIKGKMLKEFKQIQEDAYLLSKAGAFCIVIECVIESLAKKITQQIKVPTIGIGASKECDGQILVIDDIIGISNFRPKFVKKYSNIGLIIEKSVKQYCQEVKKQKFPGIKYVYKN